MIWEYGMYMVDTYKHMYEFSMDISVQSGRKLNNDGPWFLYCSLGPCSERAGASLPSPRVSKCGASVQCPVSRNYPEEIIPTYARS